MMRSRSRKTAFTLIITLITLVLLSTIVLVFLSAAILHRQISFSSSGQNRAEILVKTGLDTTVGDLISEIQAGSTAYTTNGVTFYLPATNFAVVPASTVSSSLTNLVKVSQGGTNFWSSTSYIPSTGPARASTDAHYLVSTPSANGHYLATDTWLKPDLLDSGVTNQFPAPSWILITRLGPATNGAALPAVASMADSTPTNMSYVVGRYAYAVYDAGGLVDVNVGGNALTAAQNARRGRLHQATLGQLPLVDSVGGSTNNMAAAANLVAWRSPTGSSDTNWLFNATNAFTTIDPASTNSTIGPDQAFVSRQDLIQYFKNAQTDTTHYPKGLDMNALQYLTVFTRELDQPSYTPPPLTTVTFPTQPPPGTRPQLQAASLSFTDPTSGTTYPYGLGNPNFPPGAGWEDKMNPSLVNVRDPSGSGKSIFQQRFPLSRLAWITANGPSASLSATDPTILQLLANGVSQQTINQGTAANIRTYFGLVWSGSPQYEWIYTSPDGTGNTPVAYFRTLRNIPSSRTTGPDFFETLQACISIGSLGRDAGPPAANPNSTYPSNSSGVDGTLSNVMVEDQNVSRHILQIGANIIDEARPDNFPAAYRMATQSGTTVVYGLKNLPYFTRITQLSVQDYANQLSAGYLQPEVWNPYQQANVSASTPGPTNFRIRFCTDANNPRVAGTSYSQITFFANDNGHWPTASPAPPEVTTDLTTANPIQFTLAGVAGAATPTPLTYNNTVSGSGAVWNSGAVAYLENAWYGGWLQASQSSGSSIYGFSCGTFSTKSGAPGIGYLPTSSCPGYTSQKYSKNQKYAAQVGADYNLVLEYQNNGNWNPYSVVRHIQNFLNTYNQTFCSVQSAAGYDGFQGQSASTLHIDPRTDRFGVLGRFCESGYRTSATSPLSGFEYDPFTSQTVMHCYGPPVPISGTQTDWRFLGLHTAYNDRANDNSGGTDDTAGHGAFHEPQVHWINCVGEGQYGRWIETIAANVGPGGSIYSTYYYDPDGVVRPAAAAYSVSSSPNGNPMAMNPFKPGSGSATGVVTPFTMLTSSVASCSSQPIMLNRPYCSVGELGYVFRDVPWKDLDFFTSTSGDGALLDAFSLDDCSANIAAGALPITAGKINLNSRNAVALQAVLAGAIIDESSTGSSNLIPASEAVSMAAVLVNRTGSTAAGKGPLSSKANLPLFASDFTSSTIPATPDLVIKARREAAVRALADCGNVRTWNLLIDIVAQAGKYPPNSKTPDQFVVEGEKHYWLHIALDRYTGQVVDQLLEPVNE